jgi:hypothetical protein
MKALTGEVNWEFRHASHVCGCFSFAPTELVAAHHALPPLTRWAAFFRRFAAAGLFQSAASRLRGG